MSNELKTRPCLKRYQTWMQIFLICILIKQQKHVTINTELYLITHFTKQTLNLNYLLLTLNVTVQLLDSPKAKRSFFFEIEEAVRVRTDKTNFGPLPIGLIFSVKVNHYIQCTNIAFIRRNSIFFFFFFSRRFSKWPRNWLICLGRLKFCYKRRTLPKHSVLF